VPRLDAPPSAARLSRTKPPLRLAEDDDRATRRSAWYARFASSGSHAKRALAPVQSSEHAVVLMSGFTDNVLTQQRLVDADTSFLLKLFSSDEPATEAVDALNARDGRACASWVERPGAYAQTHVGMRPTRGHFACAPTCGHSAWAHRASLPQDCVL
jgi:hypothetical protein